MSTKDSFVHLHCHSEYSMLDGAARIDDMFKQAEIEGMPAIAISDHGNLFGAFEFWKKGSATSVKPIVGMEAYYAPQGRKTRAPIYFGEMQSDESSPDSAGRGKFNYTHMTMWAENNDGLHNLFRLSSLASLEGFYYHPRMDAEILSQHGKGIIATTGCASGEVNRWLQVGNYKAAIKAASDMRDILGAENYFCELMDHGIPIETNHRADLIKLARELKLPFLATNDLHYVYPSEADAHDILLCVSTGSRVDDTKRFRFDSRDFYLKSAAEMRQVWSEFPDACDNTLLIAERCNVSFTEGANLMPEFPVPTGHTEATYLKELVFEGLKMRFKGGPIPQTHIEQAEYELRVVEQMGFPGYFLVVSDLISHARSVGIRVGPGRGSAAGALIAYALRITELDPLEHGLLFERFLNPERISMPDIDIDFDERRRTEMIQYATTKYGDERVAQIVTYGTIKAKAAIKDAGRVLGTPFAVTDAISRAMPPAVMGKDIPLQGIFDAKHARYSEAVEVRKLYDEDEEVRRVIDTARGIEGLKRQAGVHAAGVILSKLPLIDVLPVWRRDKDGAVITQFDMGVCESLGLLKMDFLGLRNLTVLDDALLNIKSNQNQEVVLEDLTLDDVKTYELLARGDTLGVFQLDGGPMRALLRSMEPDSFEDISAVIALYRPGPMGANAHNDYADYKNKRKPQVPIHPELEDALSEILGDTYGLIVYQEQVMAIAQKLAGYSLGQADLLRRAMGKKKAEILAKEFEPFKAGMQKNGFADQPIQVLWDKLVPFSDYAFNKAHSAGYGIVSYWTAYLKANFPAEYMAALLTSVKGDKDKTAIYLSECRRMGIKVLAPDVNESNADFSAVGSDIRYGLAAVRNVGENVVELIKAARTQKGRFESFPDFLAKVDVLVCNKRVIESLIKAGAFDSLNHTRKGLLDIHLEAVETSVSTKRAEASGQFDLFGALTDDDAAPSTTSTHYSIGTSEWDKKFLLSQEREMLGLYVSDHPLAGMEQVIAANTSMSIARIGELSNGNEVTLGGIIGAIDLRMSKQGKRWANVSLEDLDGMAEITFWPDTFEKFSGQLVEDNVVLIKVLAQSRGEDAVRLVARSVSAPELGVGQSGPIQIAIPEIRVTPAIMESFKTILSSHAGASPVHVTIVGENRLVAVAMTDKVAPTSAFYSDLKALLGPNCLEVPTH
jgi:DNA polymerase-3 subunit alpha